MLNSRGWIRGKICKGREVLKFPPRGSKIGPEILI